MAGGVTPKARAATQRATLAAVLSRMRPGDTLLSAGRLARVLGCSRTAAWRHIHHSIGTAGIAVASLPPHRRRRLVVRGAVLVVERLP